MDVIEFNSIGDLNIVEQNYSFNSINVSETYEKVIYNRYSTDFSLDISGTSSYKPNVILEWNNSNFTPSITFSNLSVVSYGYSITSLWDFLNNQIPVYHKWYFNLTDTTYQNTSIQSQTIYNIEIGKCADNLTYPIINMSYYDENSGAGISLTNGYNLVLYDGTYHYNVTGSFTGDFSNTLCTNLNPTNVTYNWNLWGTMTLIKDDYVTRIIDIDSVTPYPVSNNPTYELPLYMILLNESSTIIYTWYTSEFQLIDGTMRVYRCNINGSRSLVESTPIVAGASSSNIKLLNQPYAYDVIIGGTIYEDYDSFTKCHTESSLEVVYFVDVGVLEIEPILGLNSIFCSLNRTGNSTVEMSWSPNQQQDGYVSGCITAYRKTIYGSTEVYNNCSVESDGYSREVSIPVTGNTYIIRGTLEQSGNVAYCSDEVIFFTSETSAQTFGISALIGIFLLVGSLILFYAGDGEIQLVGAGIGMVIAYILGVLNFDFYIISTIIVFLMLIVAVGRYSRKGG